MAGLYPFHQHREAAAAGQLQGRDAEIVNKMARDPTYIPALDLEAVALMKRAAAPEPASEPAFKPNPVERGLLPTLLPTSLPIVGGGLWTSSLTFHLVKSMLTCAHIFQ